jgi:hypothetical protein
VGCALNTSEYRFFLNSEDYTVYRPSGEDQLRWVEAPTADECVALVQSGLRLCEWGDPIMEPIQRTAWAYEYQLDVRLRGAYIEEPDFWHLKENVSY